MMMQGKSSTDRQTDSAPAVSVIVPIYNVASYLPACLDSILVQTFREFELILVDDGSTDGSREMAEAYAKKDARIRLVKRRWNHGASSAYTLGMEMCRGRYLAFVDDDDVVAPNYLECLFTVAEQMDADVVQGAYQTFYENPGDGTVIQGYQSVEQLPENLQSRVEFFFHGRVHLAPWCKLLRKAFLDEHHIEFYEMPVAPDVSFHYQCLLTAPRYVLIPDVLYHYRQRPGSIVTVGGMERVRRYAVAMARAVEEISRWARGETLFSDEKTKWQIVVVMYAFFRFKLRELAKSLGEEEVFKVCRDAIVEEPQKSLQDARAYAELINF